MSSSQTTVSSSPALQQQALLRAHVGSRIRSRRVSVGLGLDLFAQAIGVPVQMVDDFERGSMRVDPPALFKIADVLGAPVGFFFKRD
jgi:transcriptional regulator with XRE-family HTH domain